MSATSEYLSQKEAAAHLGVSVRYFQLHVAVTPKTLPGRGAKPMLRYRRTDLDAWVDRVSDPKSRVRKAS